MTDRSKKARRKPTLWPLRHWLKRRVGRDWKARLAACAGVLLGVLLIVGAAFADEGGLFGAITAAWVQAVGSIAAIAAAIWIDRGEARRSREQEDRAQSQAEAAREKAVQNASDTFERGADRLRSAGGDPSALRRAHAGVREQLGRASRLVLVYVEPSCDARLADLLLYADQKLAGAIEAFDHQTTSQLIDTLQQAHFDLEGCVEEYQQGVW